MHFKFLWTDGTNQDFVNFSEDMENYYNMLAGGQKKRESFIPYNALADIHDVVVAYCEDKPVACAGFREHSADSAEIKRVWVSKEYRGNGISKILMCMLERRAGEKGYQNLILQTREACREACALYRSIGYSRIDNYPPYDRMQSAVCFGKKIETDIVRPLRPADR